MKPKKVPMRRCIACREMKPKRELLRIVKSPEDEVSIDKTGRMNGRGAYICNDAACFVKAKKTKALNREFKMEIRDEIYDTLEKQMEGKFDK
ncbi:MAG: YlxR family protein [Ruminiclostridium sp.]|nr:YlxR family protein [Ruminiclostridium sp.]